MPTNNNTGEVVTLNRIVDKLETLVEKLYGLEKTLTQDMIVLKDNLRSEITSLERRLDQTEIEVGRLKVIASGAIAIATILAGIVLKQQLTPQSAQAEVNRNKPSVRLEMAR